MIETISNVSANRLLGFVYSGFAIKHSAPPAYFFASKLTAKQLQNLTIHVIEELEKLNYLVLSILADNAAMDTAMFN